MGFYGAGQSINNTSFFNPSMLSNPMMNMLTSPLGPNLMGVNGGLPPHIPTPRLPNPALPANHSLPGMYYNVDYTYVLYIVSSRFKNNFMKEIDYRNKVLIWPTQNISFFSINTLK